MAVKHNAMLFGTEMDFQNLLRRYALCPPSHIDNHRGTNLTTGAGSTLQNREVRVGHGVADPALAGSANLNNVRLAEMDATHQIAYMDLEKWPKQQAASMSRGQEGGNTLYMNASYTAGGTAQPAWYLPWDDGGAAVRLTIPAKSNVVGALDPNVFITAAINGCSIFFQGTPQSPTIYHCGGPTGYKASQQNEAAEFWQAVVAEVMQADAATKGAPSFDSVDKRDYVSAVGTGKLVSGGKVDYSTPRAQGLAQELKKKYRFGRINIEEVRPWGAVVGRRDVAGNWRFYLQENATITYHQFSSNLLSRLVKGTHKAAQIARPMAVREIFPSGPHQVLISTPLPRLT